MALRVGSKRARELPTRRRADPEPMALDESAAALFLREDSGADADREEDDDEEMAVAETYYGYGGDVAMEQPRRKRAMVIRANIHFLQKLPPLANYQRGQFGRRGGVDGGTPDSDLGMLALEETMSDSGFSARATIAVAPTPVASVTVTTTSSSLQYPAHQHQQLHHQQLHHHHQQQHHQLHHHMHRNPQVLNARRNMTPAFASRPSPAPPPQQLLQFHHRSGPVAWASAGKDDEARPATSGTRL